MYVCSFFQVLAHRGQHWTLLQNAARALWNCTHTALLRTYSDENAVSLLNLETLRKLCWEPFYMAADCLLDMMVQLQQEKSSSTKVSYIVDAVYHLNKWPRTFLMRCGAVSLSMGLLPVFHTIIFIQ